MATLTKEKQETFGVPELGGMKLIWPSDVILWGKSRYSIENERNISRSLRKQYDILRTEENVTITVSKKT